MGIRYNLNCSYCGFRSHTDTGGTASEVGVSRLPGYCSNCRKITSVDVEETARNCQHCGSGQVQLYGSETRDPDSVKLPARNDLIQAADRLEREYEADSVRRRSDDEVSIRSEVAFAKTMVRDLARRKIDAGVIESWRELADITEEKIQHMIREKSEKTYWQQNHYKDREDWLDSQLSCTPEWHEGRHICPRCQKHSLTFQTGIYFD